MEDHLQNPLLRRVSVQHFPGGSLNFERFETEHIDDCVSFIQSLIERSAALNGVSIEEMRKKSLKFVTERQGEQAAQEIGARKYLECSSLSGEGVDDVFEAATRAAMLVRNPSGAVPHSGLLQPAPARDRRKSTGQLRKLKNTHDKSCCTVS